MQNQSLLCVIPAQTDTIALAATRLAAGGLVAFPTETVYGLGADATNAAAVAGIYAAKGRPSRNPLIVHVAAADEVKQYAQVDARAEALMAAFWPGPLTLVLPRLPGCILADAVSAGGATVAVRSPAHPVAQALLRACGRPLAAPSANASGRISPTEAAHVAASLVGQDILVLDGGVCMGGIESTVVDLSGEWARILRPGGVTAEMLAKHMSLDGAAVLDEGVALPSPGMLASHYAPRLPVRLNAVDVLSGEGLIAFGPEVPRGAAVVVNISRTGDVAEAARNLYAALHALDGQDLTGIAVMPVPMVAEGVAVNDRLRRAAAPRE